MGSYYESITGKKKKKKNTTSSTMFETITGKKKENTLTSEEEEKDTSGWFKESEAFADNDEDTGFWEKVGDTAKTIGGTVADAATHFTKGVTGIVEGATDLVTYGAAGVASIVGADDTAEKWKKSAQNSWNDDLYENMLSMTDKYSVLGDKSDSVAEGVGYYGGMVALQAVGVPWQVTSGVTSMSSGLTEAFNEGANTEDAIKSALVGAVAEMGSEYLFSGLGKLKGTGALDDAVVGKLTKGIKNKFIKNLAQYGLKSAGEGVEEIASGWINEVGKRLTYLKDEDKSVLKNAWEGTKDYWTQQAAQDFWAGTLVSAISGGSNLGHSIKTGRSVMNNLTANEQKVLDTEVENRFNKELKNKKNQNLSNRQKNQLRTAIEEKTMADLQKGKINVGTIENTLGKDGVVTEGRKQDSLLVNSYNNEYQKSQKFQYETTEDEIANNIYEKAQAKGLNNSVQTHEVVELGIKAAKELNLNVDFTSTEEITNNLLEQAKAEKGQELTTEEINEIKEFASKQNGYKKGNDIVLNTDSTQAAAYTLGHEIKHMLEADAETNQALNKALIKYAKYKNTYKNDMKNLKRLYNGVEGADVKGELMANYTAEFFTDEAFVSNLSTTNPTFLQKMANFFKELYYKATNNQEKLLLQKINNTIQAAYSKTANSRKDINVDRSYTVYEKPQNKADTEAKTEDNVNLPVAQEISQEQEIEPEIQENLPIEEKKVEKLEKKIEKSVKKIDKTIEKLDKIEAILTEQAYENSMKLAEKFKSNLPTDTKVKNIEGVENIKKKYDSANKVDGNSKTIVLASGEKLSGTYKLLEAGNVTASHNAETFEKTEGFPTTEKGTTVNDRDYQSDKNAQNEVNKKSKNYDGRAFADNGVIVTKDGIVVSGNDRTMSGDLAAKNNTDAAYIEYLKENAEQFGFTKEQIESMNHPRVVFELDTNVDYDTKTFAKFNKDSKKSKSVSEKAKEIGKTIDNDTITAVADVIDKFNSIDDLYNSEKATRDLINILQTKGIIDGNELSEIYNGSKFTGTGKDLVESVVLGSVISEENAKYFSNNSDLKFKIMKVAPAIIQNKTLGDYSINEELNNAIETYKKASTSKLTINEYTNQYNIFGDNDVDLITKRIAQLLETKGYKNLKNFIEKYNDMAEAPANGQRDIFSQGEVETKEDILKKALNINDETELIKYSLSEDDQGRTLSVGQENYFADCKVRDSEGRLVELYHGTPNGGFTIFDSNAKSNSGYALLGDGFYFTKSTKVADEYSQYYDEFDGSLDYTENSKVYTTYVNLTNPFVYNASEISFKKALAEIGITITNTTTDRAKIKAELIKQGYDGIIEHTDHTEFNQVVAYYSNQIKDVDNLNPTKNDDIQYSLSESTLQDKINQSLTMEDMDKMIEIAFRQNGIKDWYDGKYNNGKEWLEGEGADEVITYLENTEIIINNYLNPLSSRDEAYYNGDYYIEDIMEAYQNGTLTGYKQERVDLDTSVDTNYVDERFYSPQTIELTQELYDKANQRVTNKNRDEINKARADFIIAAHNPGTIESLGLDVKEINKKIKDWSAYTKEARELSQTLNEGVAKQNQWSGLENSSIVNTISVSNEQMEQMVKEVKGDSSGYQRKYITSTMLALDTHIDYSNLTFEFDMQRELAAESALGDYDKRTDTIRIGNGYQNTVAHEIGHYIDYQWLREITGNKNMAYPLSEYGENSVYWDLLSPEQQQFVKNYNRFISNIRDAATMGYGNKVDYYQKNTEVFARFVGKFTEWVKNKATNNRYGYEDKFYKDNFTESQYKEFVKILQEKSALDTTTNTQLSMSEQGEGTNNRLLPTLDNTELSDTKLVSEENLPLAEEIKTKAKGKNVQKAIEGFYDKEIGTPTRRQIIDKNRMLAREQLGDILSIKDKKKGILYQINTMKRNLRDIMPKEQAAEMYNTYFKPITKNNAEAEKFITSYNERIQKYNINNEESTYIQMIGEKKYNPESTLTDVEIENFYNKNRNKIDQSKCEKAADEFRNIYDELIGQINDTLVNNGYKPIEYRKGYFPHFIEEKATSPIGKLAEKLGWKVKQGTLPTDIAGITDQFKPGKVWTSFSQQRTGDATDYNALKGLDNYLRGAADTIFHTNDIQKLRALENEIRYQYSDKGVQEKIDTIYADEMLDVEEKNEAIYNLTKSMKDSMGLGNFATEIRNYTDNLANKKAFGDRSMEQTFGRDTYSIMQNINSRISANMVGANISSALTNFIPITQAWSQCSTKNLMRGMYESIRNTIKNDGFEDGSTFLINRTQQAERLYQTGLDKINNKLSIPFEAVDSFTSNTIVRAKYYDNIDAGMSETKAMDNANEFAKDVMAGRSKGDMPTIFNQKNPIVKLLTAFQLEVNNQYGYMFKDVPTDMGEEAKEKLVKAFIKMFLGAYIYNYFSEKITGRKSAFSPIDMAIDDIQTMTNENMDLGEKISAIAEDTVQELPFVGGIMGGGRLPIQSAIPYENPLEMVTETLSDASKIFDEDEDAKKTAINNLVKEWSKPVYYVLMPFAGGQIKKTIEGLSMYDENLPVAGSYTSSGKLRFEADTSMLGRLQAAVFGQYASENAREYFDNGYSPLTENQVNEALEAGMNINEYREYRNGLKKQESTEDKVDYIFNLPLADEQKNVLVNGALNRKEDIDISNYDDYGSLAEFDYANKNPEKHLAITQITDYDSYVEYKKEIEEIKEQYTNTDKRKAAIRKYINSLSLNKYQKMMLEKMAGGYSIKNYRGSLQPYINGLDLSKEEKQMIDSVLFD